MNRLQLATLLSWAGESGLQGRKRLQKVVFFLQEAGCPLDCDFTLHHFGPYSRDVADACDEMVAAGFVVEGGGPATGEKQHYTYTLTPDTWKLLEKNPDSGMASFELRAKELIRQPIWPLELGSTILFFERQTGDWQEALKKACEFKKVAPEASESAIALNLTTRYKRSNSN